MQRSLLPIIAAFTAIIFAPTAIIRAMDSQPSRQILAADANWKFFLGDPTDAKAPSYDDTSWRTVNLPHDWSIESQPDKKSPAGMGNGYYPAGTGWYRKTFSIPSDWRDKRVNVEFDGINKNATVYLNGHLLGTHPYGYTGFTFDLTPELNSTGPNVLAVRVDNSVQPSCRFYCGDGIYRHVRVIVTNPVHVAHWGVFITTPEASEALARVRVQTHVANDSASQGEVTVETTLLDQAGNQAGATESKLTIAPGYEMEVAQEIAVTNPVLWSPDSPVMYRAVSTIRKDGEVIDQVETPFGIRTLAWSADKGLLLNGKVIKLTGGSVHHDNGPLGAMAFDRAEERKVELLKAAGFNAVRTSHNPPSPAFLDACDRQGLLVMDEAFDMWAVSKSKYDYGRNFEEWWQRDLSSMVLRDRNHPSVVLWSIGNEIPESFVNWGTPIAQMLAGQLRMLDTSRPLTQAFPGSMTLPARQTIFPVLDVVGYNYNLADSYVGDHEKDPSRLMVSTEYESADAYEIWRLTRDNPFVVGGFVWLAMDHIGGTGNGAWFYVTPEEAKKAKQILSDSEKWHTVDNLFTAMANGTNIMTALTKGGGTMADMAAFMAQTLPGYPWHASNSGDIDLAGFRKPQSYYRDILWNGGDRVYATVRLPAPEGKEILAIGFAVYPTLPTWSWPGQDGKDMQVEVYSGAEKVRLYLNDKLIGEKPTGREQEFRALFSVPYNSGTLKVVGIRGDRAVAESVLTTVGNAAGLRLTADRTVVHADGQDLAFVTVEAVDAHGRPQLHADQEIQFSISGPGVIAAIGNGDGQDNASYQGDRRKLFNGRAIVVVRTSRQDGPITVTARTPGLSDGSATIQAQAAAPIAELR